MKHLAANASEQMAYFRRTGSKLFTGTGLRLLHRFQFADRAQYLRLGWPCAPLEEGLNFASSFIERNLPALKVRKVRYQPVLHVLPNLARALFGSGQFSPPSFANLLDGFHQFRCLSQSLRPVFLSPAFSDDSF